MSDLRTAAILLVAVTLLVAVQPGATPVVALNFTADCTVASLKAKILESNANPGADTLTLSNQCDYTLTTVDNSVESGDNGLPVITGNLIIEGNGATIRRSDAEATPAVRILHSEAQLLTVRDLSVIGGSAVALDANGGGIRADNALVVENSLISGNKAVGELKATGGGILAGTALTLTSSIVDQNTSLSTAGDASGGGFRSYGNITVSLSTISANQALAKTYGSGGGLTTDSGLTMTGSSVLDNISKGDQAFGGGAWAGLSADITGSTFARNYAQAYYGEEPPTIPPITGLVWGGGLYTGVADIESSSFTGNAVFAEVSGFGGGMYATGNVTVTTSTFEANGTAVVTGSGFGGAIHSSQDVTLTTSTLSGNQATGFGTAVGSRGGGVYASGITTSGSTIFDNFAGGNALAAGGGLYAFGSMSLTNTALADNRAQGNGPDTCAAAVSITAPANNASTDSTCDLAYVSADLGLLPLALNYPGTTKTHALSRTSVLYDRGQNCLPLDQTGIARPLGGCDPGAWEGGPVPSDVDCDRDGDAVDALMIMLFLAGFEREDGYPLAQAPCTNDADEDGDVDMADVHAIRLGVTSK